MKCLLAQCRIFPCSISCCRRVLLFLVCLHAGAKEWRRKKSTCQSSREGSLQTGKSVGLEGRELGGGRALPSTEMWELLRLLPPLFSVLGQQNWLRFLVCSIWALLQLFTSCSVFLAELILEFCLLLPFWLPNLPTFLIETTQLQQEICDEQLINASCLNLQSTLLVRELEESSYFSPLMQGNQFLLHFSAWTGASQVRRVFLWSKQWFARRNPYQFWETDKLCCRRGRYMRNTISGALALRALGCYCHFLFSSENLPAMSCPVFWTVLMWLMVIFYS